MKRAIIVLLFIIVVAVVVGAILFLRRDNSVSAVMPAVNEAVPKVKDTSAGVDHLGAVADKELPAIRTAPAGTATDVKGAGHSASVVAGKEKAELLPESKDVVVAEELNRVTAAIAMAKDTSIDLPKRKKTLENLGRQGDEESIKVLMAVGDAHIYLNSEAVKALGLSRSESVEVSDYLKKKISDGDVSIVMAAIDSLALVMRQDAVAVIDSAFALNYRRNDGHGETVCTHAIKALQGLHAKSATPIYVRELKRAQDKLYSLEYGSAVIAALAEVGGKAESVVINDYADALERDLPDDEMARKAITDRIDATRKVAAGLGN